MGAESGTDHTAKSTTITGLGAECWAVSYLIANLSSEFTGFRCRQREDPALLPLLLDTDRWLNENKRLSLIHLQQRYN